jgi:glutamate racemase
MTENPVVFIDSGVGGLPYMDWVRQELPEQEYVYVADPKNFPYGIRKPQQIIDIVTANVDLIREVFNPSMIVVACNTATVHALSRLRELYPFPVVGVVPAVKPAAIYSPNRRIGILATERTIRAPYLDNLVNEFASACTVYRVAAGNIIDYIEKRYFHRDEEEMFTLMEEALSELKRHQVDAVVLGCTHFIFMDEAIGRYMGSPVKIIDSREGVGRQVLRMLQRYNLFRPSAVRPGFFTTGGLSPADEDHYRLFAGHFDLEWGGRL